MPLSKRATNITNRFSIKALLVLFPESEKVMTIISIKQIFSTSGYFQIFIFNKTEGRPN